MRTKEEAASVDTLVHRLYRKKNYHTQAQTLCSISFTCTNKTMAISSPSTHRHSFVHVFYLMLRFNDWCVHLCVCVEAFQVTHFVVQTKRMNSKVFFIARLFLPINKQLALTTISCDVCCADSHASRYKEDKKLSP